MVIVWTLLWLFLVLLPLSLLTLPMLFVTTSLRSLKLFWTLLNVCVFGSLFFYGAVAWVGRDDSGLGGIQTDGLTALSHFVWKFALPLLGHLTVLILGDYFYRIHGRALRQALR